jgi:hypothetical protein
MAGGTALRKMQKSEHEPPSKRNQKYDGDRNRHNVSPSTRIRIFGANVEKSHIFPQNFSLTVAV